MDENLVMEMHAERVALTETIEDQILREIRELRASHEKILAQISEISAAVGPTINALKDSPILKMMGV